MAEAIPNKSASIHGVVHKIGYKDMRLLDRTETDMERTWCCAYLNNGTTVEATFYTRPDKDIYIDQHYPSSTP